LNIDLEVELKPIRSGLSPIKTLRLGAPADVGAECQEGLNRNLSRSRPPGRR
jgi:hypothetical protein